MALRIFALIVPLAYCQITINVIVSTSSNEVKVEETGSDIEIISDAERGVFNITDEYLKDAVARYSGGRPSEVYLKSPTPWNDLYETYRWDQVRRILIAETRVMSVTSQNVVLYKQKFVNNGSAKNVFRTSIARQAHISITNIWKTKANLTVNQDITYNMSFLTPGTTIVYQNPWGEDKSFIRPVLVGTSKAVDVIIEAGQSVMVMLVAKRGILDLEVDYTSKLEGDVACNYGKQFKGHYFWSYNIRSILNAGGMPTKVLSKEFLNVIFYSSARIIVFDTRSSAKLLDVPADVILKGLTIAK